MKYLFTFSMIRGRSLSKFFFGTFLKRVSFTIEVVSTAQLKEILSLHLKQLVGRLTEVKYVIIELRLFFNLSQFICYFFFGVMQTIAEKKKKENSFQQVSERETKKIISFNIFIAISKRMNGDSLCLINSTIIKSLALVRLPFFPSQSTVGRNGTRKKIFMGFSLSWNARLLFIN